MFYIHNGRLGSIGKDSYNWSKTASLNHYTGIKSPSAYNLSFTNTSASPSGGPHYRWVARPLRCLK